MLSVSLAGHLREGVAAALREAAERVIMPGYGTLTACDVAFKAPGEVVTAIDHACEQLLAERLSALHPEAHVVGEEAVGAAPGLEALLATDLCWIIDPLDGTANYAAGTGPFGIMVALADAGEIMGGWLLDPLTGRLCGAERGHGARIDGALFRSVDARRDPPRAAVSRLFSDAARRERVIAALVGCEVVDSPRCAADQYPRVAAGLHDLTYFDRTISWDHAAGVVFLNESGGRAAHPDGSAYRVGRQSASLLVATSPAIWDRFALNVAAAL